MAEILTDPVTGQRRSVEVRYDEPGGMGDINPQAVNQLFQTQKMEDAEKALSAAIQFQGLRGYQQALKSGETAEKAMTRYGPMMFYQRPSAVGSAIRSVTPRPQPPMIRSAPGGEFVQIDPMTGTVKQLRAPNPAKPSPVRPEKFSAVVGMDAMLQPQRLPMTGGQFQSFMATAPPELKTNSINSVISQILKPPTTATNSAPRIRRWNRQAGKFE